MKNGEGLIDNSTMVAIRQSLDYLPTEVAKKCYASGVDDICSAV
jgi:hypothetical protein